MGKYKPNVIRGGVAIPLSNKSNIYYMSGRKHAAGGIDIGKNLEVEDGELYQIKGKSSRVFSAVPFLNGVSPAKLVMQGADPDSVFNAQEEYKFDNHINDDGTKYPFGGVYAPFMAVRNKIINDIKKWVKGKDSDTKYRTNLYNAIDPTQGYPTYARDYVRLASNVLESKTKDSVEKRREYDDKLADAAWAKRLELPYDESQLIDNGDGTFRIPSHREMEIPVDTNLYKDRIAYNEKLAKRYNPWDPRREVIEDGIAIDKNTLKALRKTYATGEPVTVNEMGYNNRKWIRNGNIEQGISPLNIFQDYTIQYDKDNNRMNYSDIYDFDNANYKLDDWVPGKPFNIKGSIDLNKRRMGGLSRSKDYGSSKKPYPNVSSDKFAGPNRTYPIPTKADARDALRLAGLHGNKSVTRKVLDEYLSLKKAKFGTIRKNLTLTTGNRKFVTPVGTVSPGGFVANNTRGSYGGGKGSGGGAGTKLRDVPEYETTVKNDTIFIPVERTLNDAFREAVRQGKKEFYFNGEKKVVEFGDNPRWKEVGDAIKETTLVPVITERKHTERVKEYGGKTKGQPKVVTPVEIGGRPREYGLIDVHPEFDILTLGKKFGEQLAENTLENIPAIYTKITKNLPIKKIIKNTPKSVKDGIKYATGLGAVGAASYEAGKGFANLTERINKKPLGGIVAVNGNVKNGLIPYSTNRKKALFGIGQGDFLKAYKRNANKYLQDRYLDNDLNEVVVTAPRIVYPEEYEYTSSIPGHEEGNVIKYDEYGNPLGYINGINGEFVPYTRNFTFNKVDTDKLVNSVPTYQITSLGNKRDFASAVNRNFNNYIRTRNQTPTVNVPNVESNTTNSTRRSNNNTSVVTPVASDNPTTTSPITSIEGVPIQTLIDQALNNVFEKNRKSTTTTPITSTPITTTTNGSNTTKTTNSKLKLSSDNISDMIGLGSNLLSSIIGYNINRRMLNSLRNSPAPIQLAANKLKTNYNINPQRRALLETITDYNRDITENTASSATAAARRQKNIAAGLTQINALEASKAEKENELINSDIANRQGARNTNIAKYNEYREKTTDRYNDWLDKISVNKQGFVGNINKAIQDTITRYEKRNAERQNRLAMLAAYPNVNPMILRTIGVKGITDEDVENWLKAYGK